MRLASSLCVVMMFGVASAASAQTKPVAAEEKTEKKADIRVQGGFVNHYGTGVIIGGGVGFRPLKNRPQVEAAGDIFYYKYNDAAASGFIYPGDEEPGEGNNSGSKGWYGSVNGIFNFAEVGSRAITPFVGAGVGFANGGGTTAVRPQVLGGVTLPLASLAVRAEVRLFLTRGKPTTIVLFGVQF